ncbi:MAG: hypothetical protein GQ565_04980 [Candidatus Aegiribacteria sp.]|nr:hypothetical protein [Candidatus Aegiribacteria sp.]
MSKKVDAAVVQAILYGIYKALYKITGASAAAVMRQAAPDILVGLTKFGVKLPQVTNIDELSKAVNGVVTEAGCCDSIEFKLDDDILTANISNCTFFDLTMALKELDIPPFGCPFAALTLALAQQNLGKTPRIVFLEPTEGGQKGDTTLKIQLS